MANINRPRRSTADASSYEPAPNQGGEVPTVNYPWPRPNKKAFALDAAYNDPIKMSRTQQYLNRPVTELWNHYDSMNYNGLLGMRFEATRVLHRPTLEKMGIEDEVGSALIKSGLGTVCSGANPLCEEYVRQCLASCMVTYTDPLQQKASEGTFNFKINGVLYGISLRGICRVFGFDERKEETELPEVLPDHQLLWEIIGRNVFQSTGQSISTQSQIKHPVLRVLAKAFAHTICCTMETNKMRLSYLILLSYAFGDLFGFAPEYTHRHGVNFGAVLAHRFCEVKERGWTRAGKKESIGSLLYPIFRAAGVDMRRVKTDSPAAYLDEGSLKNSQIIRYTSTDAASREIVYMFQDEDGKKEVVLPCAFTGVATVDALRFEVPLRELWRPSFQTHHTTQRRGVPQAAPTSESDRLHSAPPSRTEHTSIPRGLGPFPHPPEATYSDQPAFNRWLAGVMEKVWDKIGSCSCSRRDDTAYPRPPSPPHWTRADRDRTHDEAGPSRDPRRQRTRSSSPSDHI